MKKRGLSLFLTVMTCMVLFTVPAAAGEQNITNGEFAQIIVDKISLSGDISGVEKPLDVSEDHPYYHAIMLCKKYEFFYLDHVYPDMPMNRGDAAGHLTRMAKIIGMAPPEGTPPEFSDTIYTSVRTCCQYGMMSGYPDGTFRPYEDVIPSDLNWKPLDDAITALQPVGEPVELDLSLGSITISEAYYGGSVYEQGNTRIISTGACIIRQNDASGPTGNRITVQSGKQKFAIADLNVKTEKTEESPIAVQNNAALTLVLSGRNALTARGDYAPGIRVPEDAALTIRGAGTLTVQGGPNGAGIGGGYPGNSGTITVESGTIHAFGGSSGAGIGGGHEGNGGVITINGGAVTAIGGGYSAGIGGGCYGSGGTITIHNGNVEATGTGDESGAGIGGGCGGDGGTIAIHNGIVTATGGIGGAGIGSGHAGRDGNTPNGGSITITDGTVTATGGSDSAGIGGGWFGTGGSVHVEGGTVHAMGGSNGAGIGGGWNGSGSTVAISGGTVIAEGGSEGAGIGGGSGGSGETVSITGGDVTATGGKTAAGIGGGKFCGSGDVLIQDAKVTATGGCHAIGGGTPDNKNGCSSITIGESAEVHFTHTDPKGSDCQERIDGLEPAITEAAALEDQPAGFPIEVESHSGIRTYQWQTSPDNHETSAWTEVEGQTAATLSVPVTKANENYFYRCQVTNQYGNTAYTGAIYLRILQITRQPVSVTAAPNDGALFEVDASASCAAYAWQKSSDHGVHWTPVEKGTKKTLVVNTPLSDHNALYRCCVTVPNGDFVFSDAARLTVQSVNPTYTVYYYLEKPEGGYEVFDRVVEEQPAGTAVTAPERTFANYTEHTSMGDHGGTVAADNTLVLSRYYDRNSFTLRFEPNGGTQLPDLTEKFGKAITLPKPSRMGCSFGGWYADTGCTKAVNLTEMPAQDMTLYAKWELIGEGRGEEYHLNGITLRDSAYQPVTGAIPAGHFYAEVSITNLSSTTMDTVLLASYDQNGRMLGLTFLYANPQIGQTFVLGSMFDNSKGEIAELRAFTLPMLGGLAPLSNSVTYPAK